MSIYSAIQQKINPNSWPKQLQLDGITPDLIENSPCFVREVGTSLVKRCQFPFKFKGQTYNDCVKENSQFDEFHWCSTLVDNNSREHIYGHRFFL